MSSSKKIVLILAVLCVRVSTVEEIRFARGMKGPLHGRAYFAIAVPSSGQSFSRAFNKTLTNITQNHFFGSVDRTHYNISLEPMVIELPDNGTFSAVFLQHVCDMFEGKHIVAVLVIGSTPAAFTVSLTARHVGIPVLWAQGHTEFLPGFRSLSSINHRANYPSPVDALAACCRKADKNRIGNLPDSKQILNRGLVVRIGREDSISKHTVCSKMTTTRQLNNNTTTTTKITIDLSPSPPTSDKTFTFTKFKRSHHLQHSFKSTPLVLNTLKDRKAEPNKIPQQLEVLHG
ncbi:hypothetical protein HUJ04_002226 [Dendroctonus ponderosae]|nr:hypothetical protein HUJ04_002226 [Dendroctonus ponderosae]